MVTHTRTRCHAHAHTHCLPAAEVPLPPCPAGTFSVLCLRPLPVCIPTYCSIYHIRKLHFNLSTYENLQLEPRPATPSPMPLCLLQGMHANCVGQLSFLATLASLPPVALRLCRPQTCRDWKQFRAAIWQSLMQWPKGRKGERGWRLQGGLGGCRGFWRDVGS